MKTFLIVTNPEYALSPDGDMQLVIESQTIEVAGEKMLVDSSGARDYLIIKNKSNESVFNMVMDSVRYCKVVDSAKGILISAVNSNVGTDGDMK